MLRHHGHMSGIGKMRENMIFLGMQRGIGKKNGEKEKMRKKDGK